MKKSKKTGGYVIKKMHHMIEITLARTKAKFKRKISTTPMKKRNDKNDIPSKSCPVQSLCKCMYAVTMCMRANNRGNKSRKKKRVAPASIRRSIWSQRNEKNRKKQINPPY